MYFKRFPKTFYSLDDRVSIQLVTSIFLRVGFSDEIKNNLSIFDEYDIKDGDTPEILADVLYSNSQLHWIILHMNEILDPRFDWPLSSQNFRNYITEKYNNIDAIHHYEDVDGNVVNGHVYLNSNSAFTNFNVGSIVANATNAGNAVITAKTSDSNVKVMVSDGGFKTGDNIRLVSNALVAANVTSTAATIGIPVTNYVFEDRVNESKRRIKILKPQYVDTIVKDFNSKLENVNG